LGLWSAVGCPTQVFLAAISADDFHPRMLPEPFGKGFRTAVARGGLLAGEFLN
jgi:hypothetical protein